MTTRGGNISQSVAGMTIASDDRKKQTEPKNIAADSNRGLIGAFLIASGLYLQILFQNLPFFAWPLGLCLVIAGALVSPRQAVSKREILAVAVLVLSLLVAVPLSMGSQAHPTLSIAILTVPYAPLYCAKVDRKALWLMLPLLLAESALVIHQGLVSGERVAGFFQNQNHAAAFLLLGSLCLWLSSWKALAIIPAFAMTFTGSREAVLVLCIVGAVFMARKVLAKELTPIDILLIGALGLIIVFRLDAGVFMRENGILSPNQHFYIPGYLPSFVPKGYLDVAGSHGMVHSTPVRIAYEAGIPAACAWVYLTIKGLKASLSTAFGLIALAVALLSLVDITLWIGALAGCWWLMLGMRHQETVVVKKAVHMPFRSLRVALVLIFGCGSLLMVTPAFATPPPPTVTLSEVHFFEDVYETGDILMIGRFVLPLLDWQSDTCQGTPYVGTNPIATRCMNFVSSTANAVVCTDAKDFTDRCYTAVLPGVASAKVVTSAAVIIGYAELARVGAGLTGMYFCAPSSTICTGNAASSITWEDSALQVCIDGPTTVTPRPEQCKSDAGINWHTSVSIAATQALAPAVFQGIYASLTIDASAGKTQLLNNGQITDQGALFAQEAWAGIVNAIPELFVSAVSNGTGNFNPAAAQAGHSLTDQTTQAQTGGVYKTLNSGGQFWGLNGVTFGSFVWMFIGLVVFTVVTGFSGGMPHVGALAGWIVLFAGAWFGSVPWAAFMILSLLLIAVGSTYFFREKIPG